MTMGKDAVMRGAVIGLVIGLACWGGATLWATEATSKAGSSEITKADLTKLDRKLDQILANQQTIFQKFDAVMEELKIIKVRATLHRSGS